MNQTLSRKDLCGYLSLLRKEMIGRNLFPAPNVIFLNSRALYHHLAKQPCAGDTIGGILKKIETCIPLAVTEESFSLFFRCIYTVTIHVGELITVNESALHDPSES